MSGHDAPSQDAPSHHAPSPGLRPVVARVAGLNLAMFFIEIAVALAIGSVALLADSLDFLEDAAINRLILAGLGWSARNRARLGTAMAGVLVLPALGGLVAAYGKVATMAPPDALPLTLTGVAALGVNLVCAGMLARHRSGGGSLTRAAYLSARNDVAAGLAVVAAGGLTAATLSPWPDLVVGLGILALNADSALDILKAARAERRAAQAEVKA